MGPLEGKLALVTGGTSGIGLAIASGLAADGAEVVLLARDPARAAAATDVIVRRTPGAKVSTIPADLASQGSIRAAAAEFDRTHPALHVFVGAAGVFHRTRSETVDGIEATFAVNYLSHYLLANLLEGALRRGGPGRVVLVASRYGGSRLDFDDLMIQRRKFTVLGSVGPTKLAEVLLVQELAERWKGTGITVNAIHPGLVAGTRLLTEVGGLWRWMTNTFGGTPERGADSALWLVTSPDAAALSGKLVARRRTLPTPGQGSDPAARRRLWEESARLTERSAAGPAP